MEEIMPLKRIAGRSLLLLCGSILPTLAQTQAPAPASKPANAPLKVGVVQFQPAVTATNEFQRDLAAVQKKFEPRQTELKNLSDEIDRLTKELQAGAASLSEAEQESRARTIDTKKKQAQRLAEDGQNDYGQAMQEIFDRIEAKFGDVLTSYATEHGFTLVVDRSEQQDQTPIVLWADPSIDITQQVVDAYNVKSGIPAQGASAPGPPAPKAAPPR
jgi:outer membrane protein